MTDIIQLTANPNQREKSVNRASSQTNKMHITCCQETERDKFVITL